MESWLTTKDRSDEGEVDAQQTTMTQLGRQSVEYSHNLIIFSSYRFSSSAGLDGLRVGGLRLVRPLCWCPSSEDCTAPGTATYLVLQHDWRRR